MVMKKVFSRLQRNRWLIALAAGGIHISIGSVYAWSVLVNPIIAENGWSLSETTFAFSLAILFLGLSAGFFGNLVDKYGAKNVGLMASSLFGLGLFGTAMALSVHNIFLLYLFYGVVGGCGLGLGYVTPVSTLVKYFPENRGFATGLSIMSFGFAALIAAPLMQFLSFTYGLVSNFLILGFAYMIIMTLSSLYLAPPKGYNEETDFVGEDIAPKDVYGTWQFKALWLIFFLNISCGIALLSVVSPMAQDVVGFSPTRAAALVGIVGLLNGMGRIVWATISDYIGRGYTYVTFFVLEIVMFFLLATTTSEFLFELFVLIIITCYGGGFSCMPAYLSDIFGTRHLSTIHGRILTAWGFAGIAGPLLLTFTKTMFGSYQLIMYLFSAIFVINLIIAWVLKDKGQQLYETEEEK
jgi:OFA family oxalate/formate antiporter-like MFS transporter